MSEPVIDLLEETWRSTSGLAQSFADDEWATLTECPGWSTKDILSHLIGIERKLLVLPDDPPLAEYPDYVRNDLGKFGENSIAVRRPRSGTDVLAEFDTVTT